jgi:signal transduction histidine kinase
VRVEAQQTSDAEARQLECRFRDSGPGFEETDLALAFEPFYSRRQGGTGLGLAIAWRFTREHDGTIAAGNHPEGGAVLTVRLPVS